MFALGFWVGVLVEMARTARPGRELPQCTCGHDARAHEHLRPGTWCALCPRFGSDACLAYELAYEPVRRPAAPDTDARVVDLLAAIARERTRARTDAALGRIPAV